MKHKCVKQPDCKITTYEIINVKLLENSKQSINIITNKLLNCVRLFEVPWTVARQAPLSMEFSPVKNTGVGSHSLLQEIFPTQGSNLGLLLSRQILYCLSRQGSPIIVTATI